jgi:hypothetical protein
MPPISIGGAVTSNIFCENHQRPLLDKVSSCGPRPAAIVATVHRYYVGESILQPPPPRSLSLRLIRVSHANIALPAKTIRLLRDLRALLHETDRQYPFTDSANFRMKHLPQDKIWMSSSGRASVTMPF